MAGDWFVMNFQSIKLNNKDPVYAQIVLFVKQQILTKNAVSGEEMPSRRELAAQLNINPNTVQKAYKLLEKEDIIETHGNQGSIICIDEAGFSRIEDELTRGMVREFISSAKAINLSFKRVFDLISEMWEEN